MAAAVLVSWHDIADDVREWVIATKPETSHSRWANIVRKRSVEHWRIQIDGDVEYQATRVPEVPSPTVVVQPTVAEEPELVKSSLRRRHRRRVHSTKDSFASVRQKQRDRIDAATTNSTATSSGAVARAQKTAIARAAIHGSATAAEAGAVAAAQVYTSEQLASTGMGSIHTAGTTALMGRVRRSPPPRSTLSLSATHRCKYEAAIARAGIASFESNKLGLYKNSTIEEIANAVQNANSIPKMAFGPISMAASSFSGYRTLSSSLEDAVQPSSADEHMAALKQVFGAR